MKNLIFLISTFLLISCGEVNKPTNTTTKIDRYNMTHDDGTYTIVEGGLYRYMEQYNNLYGYMDRFDNIIIQAKYYDAKQFSDSLAAVSIDNEWGFIDKYGKLVIPFKYDWVSSFSEYGLNGIAMVKTDMDLHRKIHGGLPIFFDGKTSFINTKGEPVTPHMYKSFLYPQYDGLMTMIGFDDKWGLINMDAQELFPCVYDSIYYNKGLDSLYFYKEGIKKDYAIKDLLRKQK